jgi:hypothetical protein
MSEMSIWCPRCGAEYIEGWGTCSECGVELVDTPPKRERGFQEEDAIFIEPRRARSYDDPFIAIWEGPTPEGTILARQLQAVHIPVELGEAAEPGRLRLEVPQSYIDEAYEALDAADPYVLPAGEPDDNGESPWDEPIGWSPATRVVFFIVAITLVVALVLAYR